MAVNPLVYSAGLSSLEVGTGRLPVIPAYLTWGDPITDPASALGSLTFDAILSEEHERSSQVTDHPVEQGTNIVDNVRPLPDRLTLEVFVSDSPIASPDAPLSSATLNVPMPGQVTIANQSSLLSGGMSAPLNALANPPPGPTVGASVRQFAGYTNYPAKTLSVLDQLRTQALLVSVLTPKASYTNMILESVRMHRNPGTGTSARFTLEFREIVMVTSRIVAAPLPSIPRAATVANVGKKQTAPATTPMESVGVARAKAAGLLTGPPGS